MDGDEQRQVALQFSDRIEVEARGAKPCREPLEIDGKIDAGASLLVSHDTNALRLRHSGVDTVPCSLPLDSRRGVAGRPAGHPLDEAGFKARRLWQHRAELP